MDERHVAVVGAGLSGLTAAVLLRRRGLKCTVFEKASHVGGRAQTRVREGCHFNLGPHALYCGGLGWHILKGLGVPVDGAPPPLGTGLMAAGSRLVPLPMTPGAVMTSPLFTTLGARLEAVRALALLFGSRPGRFRQVTLQDWLNQYVTRLEVQQFVLALVRLSTYVNAPGLVSAGAILEQMQVGRKGVVYLHGGWQTLVDALEQQARRAGAGFRHDKVETADGRSLTLRSGETLAVDATILAVPPEAATELSGLTFAVNPVRAACLDVGLRRLPVPSHTFMLGVDQPHYFSVHSASARLAPPGLHVVHVARYLAPDEDEGHADDLEDVLDTMQPGWRDEVVERSFMPHLTVTADLPAAGRPRAGVRVSDSLCLAGDWVGSEAMLCDTALASAQAAVTAVTTQLGADVQHVS